MSTISRKAAQGIALVAVSALVLVGCAAAPEDEGTNSAEGETSTETEAPAESIDYKACMVSDAGGYNDASFNQEAYAGLLRAVDELGVEKAEVESPPSATQTDYATGVDSMISEGCDIVIGVGFLLGSAIRDAAIANPDVNFAIIDSGLSNDDFSPLSLPNVKPIQYDTAEAAFLAGYLAAATTKTGKVATYGGLLLPSVTIFMDGFKQGVDHHNSEKGTSVEVLGATGDDISTWAAVGNFDNIADGKVLSENFIQNGADIVLPVAGPVGIGTGQATLENDGAQVIGVDSDWFNLDAHTEYKSNILTSIEKKMADAVFAVIESGTAGSFLGGDENQYIGNLANGGVRISPEHDVTYPAGIQAELEALQDAIISGELVVTSIYK